MRAFCLCLAGLYKRSDVDLVREQILAALRTPPAAIQLNYEGLLAWTDLHAEPTFYPLRDDPDNPDRAAETQRMVFAQMPILWDQWLECWEKDQDGEGQPGLPGLSDSLVQLRGPVEATPPAAEGRPGRGPTRIEETIHGAETSDAHAG